jgi:HK97 family phage prohead protease
MRPERRTLPATAVGALELRAADGAPTRIAGYAAVFNTLSEDLGGFRELIAPGAFRRAVADDDVRALWNHDANLVLGRNTAGTLTLREDTRGLAYDVEPPDTQWGRDAVVSIRRGDVTGSSFGFRTVTDRWVTQDGENLRTLVEVELFDVSPVTYPAYAAASVSARSWLEGAGVEDPALVAPELLRAIVRRERNLAPVDGDRALLVRAVSRLTELTPAESAAPEAQVRTMSAERLKRELALLEAGADDAGAAGDRLGRVGARWRVPELLGPRRAGSSACTAGHAGTPRDAARQCSRT